MDLKQEVKARVSELRQFHHYEAAKLMERLAERAYPSHNATFFVKVYRGSKTGNRGSDHHSKTRTFRHRDDADAFFDQMKKECRVKLDKGMRTTTGHLPGCYKVYFYKDSELERVEILYRKEKSA